MRNQCCVSSGTLAVGSSGHCLILSDGNFWFDAENSNLSNVEDLSVNIGNGLVDLGDIII